jgi:ABC-2 type transport system permease protein
MKLIKNWVGFRTLVKREILRFFVVASQTIIPPLISSTLFIFVFGYSLGSRMNLSIQGSTYLEYIIPGLVMMHLVESPYANTSSSLFISRWHNLIQEMLLSPLSYFEMVLGLLIGGVTRGLLVGSGVYGVSLIFCRFEFHSWPVVLYFFFFVPLIFALLGLLVGLWAEGFEKLSFWSTFVLTPLVYFGGVFHSVEMVPAPLRWITHLDPIFYFVSGLRYGMAAGLFILVERLFRAGYKLRS